MQYRDLYRDRDERRLDRGVKTATGKATAFADIKGCLSPRREAAPVGVVR